MEEKTQREEELSNAPCVEGCSFLAVRPAGECQVKDQENRVMAARKRHLPGDFGAVITSFALKILNGKASGGMGVSGLHFPG